MGLSSKQVTNSPQLGGLEISSKLPEVGGGSERTTPLICPRCESNNTKFCYYNNYSRSQPRHLCRACRRHWTAGGTLRNVPVGGGRKNKRQKTATGDAPATGSTAPPSLPRELDGNAAFTDILRPVFIHPLPPLPPPSEMVNSSGECGILSSGFGFSECLPFMPATFSTSSSDFSYRGEDVFGASSGEGLLGITPANACFQESPAFPASYWDFWDGNIDLRQPASGE